jgi:RHS repeat-associated protein
MFTGEMVDANDLVYLRARYYVPGLGVFTGLDQVEGDIGQIMSLNRYGYVAGNVVNSVDPSGMIMEHPGAWDPCAQMGNDCSCYDPFKTVLIPHNESYVIMTEVEACQNNVVGFPECTPTPSATPPPTNTPRPTPAPFYARYSVFGSVAAMPIEGDTEWYGPNHPAIDLVPAGNQNNAQGTPVFTVCGGRLKHKGNNSDPRYENIVEEVCDGPDRKEQYLIVYSHICPTQGLRNLYHAEDYPVQIGVLAALQGQGSGTICEDPGNYYRFEGASHLHFEVQDSQDNSPIPPTQFLVECNPANPADWCGVAGDINQTRPR